MWMKTSQRQSGRPASSTSTRVEASALRRLASAQPAEPPPTITKSEDAADLTLEGGDVLGRDRLRPPRVAGRDRHQQAAVLVDAVEQVRKPPEHEVPDAQRQVEVALERLAQVRVAGAAIDEAMHARVERHQIRWVAAAGVDLGDQRLELGPLPGREALG